MCIGMIANIVIGTILKMALHLPNRTSHIVYGMQCLAVILNVGGLDRSQCCGSAGGLILGTHHGLFHQLLCQPTMEEDYGKVRWTLDLDILVDAGYWFAAQMRKAV